LSLDNKCLVVAIMNGTIYIFEYNYSTYEFDKQAIIITFHLIEVYSLF